MPRRVAASALAVALAVAVHLSLAPSPIAHSAPAQDTPTQATEVGIQIELVEEQYAFEPDASLHLVYRLTGDLASLDLGVEVPATTVPTVPVPTETAPVDTTPIDTATTGHRGTRDRGTRDHGAGHRLSRRHPCSHSGSR